MQIEEAVTIANPSESYDGSRAIYRLLRLAACGSPLMNLGYFGFRGPLGFLNVLSPMDIAQRRLVTRAAKMLDVRARHQVLDVACGRGQSSFMMQCMHPEAIVTGLDLLDHHVDTARTLFANTRHLSYVTGDAMLLDFGHETMDRMMCLEAAFHFPDRSQFLREAFRVLRPGGRLVVVDFAWNTDADRAHRNDPETRLVRDAWQWDDFSSVSEYKQMAVHSGLRVSNAHDWSGHVTRPIQNQLRLVSALSKSALGRRLLCWTNPLLRAFTSDDWAACAATVAAHGHVQKHSKYMAFVFEKN